MVEGTRDLQGLGWHTNTLPFVCAYGVQMSIQPGYSLGGQRYLLLAIDC